MKKVCVATSRDIGRKCFTWAKNNCPEGFELTTDIESSDIVISVLYEKILKPNIVNNKKCYNFHPGILPEYKGSGICSWAIINKEEYMGTTLHIIDEGVDTGEVICIEKFKIFEEDTAYSLFKKTEELIYSMFKQWFVKLLKEEFVCKPQIKSNHVLYKKKDLQSAMDLTRFVKAFHFPGKPSAFYVNQSGEKKYINFDC